MQVFELDNKTKHPISIALRQAGGGKTAIGTASFDETVITFRPGINTLSEDEHEKVQYVRSKSPVVNRRFARGELVAKSRNATRSELEDKIRRCSDPETLKRWRSSMSNKDKGLLSLVEDQLAACTTTAAGDITDNEVLRDPKDPKKGGR